MARGRHAKPSKLPRFARDLTLTGMSGAALVALTASPANATPDEVWAQVAGCESGGNPTAQNPTSTASGLYQILDGTWRDFGGTEFAPRALGATPEQQKIVAERVLAAQGPGAWVAGCGDPLAEWLAAGAPVPPKVEPPVPPAEPATPVAPVEPVVPATIRGQVTVVSGDWLSKFTPEWRDLYAANVDVIGPNPDLIFPGQVLDVPDTVEFINRIDSTELPPVPPASSPAPVTEEAAPPVVEDTGGRHAAPEPAGGAAAAAVEVALAQTGDAYLWAAEGPDSFDCSGLVVYAYGQAGIALPRTSSAQSQAGVAVSREELQLGDLVFYYSPVSHVAIYIGNGQVVQAANPQQGVIVTDVDWGGTPVGYRRVA